LIPPPDLTERMYTSVATTVNHRQSIKQSLITGKDILNLSRPTRIQRFVEICFQIGICKLRFHGYPFQIKKLASSMSFGFESKPSRNVRDQSTVLCRS
jgi:hypothetical protein